MELPINYDAASRLERRTAREAYIFLQENLCCHCGESLDKNPSKNILEAWIDESLFPRNFFDYPIHLHHNHDTGLTIGVVHNRCNAFLWQYCGE